VRPRHTPGPHVEASDGVAVGFHAAAAASAAACVYVPCGLQSKKD
jgi:hypothetical protein